MLPELKRPWELIDVTAAEKAVAELLRELGPDHPLKRKKVQAVAARCDCDDVLFLLVDEKPACAVVHLTYAGRQEPPNWPETNLFPSVDDWVRDCMIPDYDDYYTGE
jgi:hypothetical protein